MFDLFFDVLSYLFKSRCSKGRSELKKNKDFIRMIRKPSINSNKKLFYKNSLDIDMTEETISIMGDEGELLRGSTTSIYS